MATGDDRGDWAAPGSSVPPPGWSAQQPPPAAPPPPGWAPAGAAYHPWMPQALRPGIVPLRPLGVGEILDGAFTAMRRYPRVTLGLAALVATAQQLIALGLDVWTGDLSSPSAFSGFTTSDVIRLPVNFALSAVLVGMLTIVIADGVLGRDVTLESLWTRVRPLFWPLLGASFLAAVLPFFGLIGLIIGGVFLWTALSFTTPALVLERLGVGMALRRSWRLAVPAFWRVLGVRLLALIIAAVIASIISIPGAIIAFSDAVASINSSNTVHFGFAAEAAIRLSALIGTTLTAPFSAGVVALLYIDRRMRAEALDVTLARAATESQPA